MNVGRADCSFPRAYRLVSSEDFRRVYQCALRGRAGPFSWFARANEYRYPRLGLAVPKRVLKRSTDRSRVKRLIRESFRRNRTRLPPVDVVISVKILPHDLHDPALNKAVDRLWEDVLSNIKNKP